MARPDTIHCFRPLCKKPCGLYYPATSTNWDGAGEQGYGEGVGEDFVDPQGNWHCSQTCLDVTLAELAENVPEDEVEEPKYWCGRCGHKSMDTNLKCSHCDKEANV